MTSESLIQEAESLGITVNRFPLPLNGSCSVSLNNRLFIGIDNRRAADSLQRVRIAHELGHCVNDAFYLPHAPIRSRRKCERIANEYAIQKLIPEEDFFEAIKKGDTEPWQIAERFDVTPEFAYKAMKYYHDRGMQ